MKRSFFFVWYAAAVQQGQCYAPGCHISSTFNSASSIDNFHRASTSRLFFVFVVEVALGGDHQAVFFLG